MGSDSIDFDSQLFLNEKIHKIRKNQWKSMGSDSIDFDNQLFLNEKIHKISA